MWSSYFCNGTVRVQSWKLWQTINLLTAINFWWFMVNHKSALSMTLILGLDFPPPSILQSICKHSFSTDSNWWWVQIQFNPFFAPTHESVFLFSEWCNFSLESFYSWRNFPFWNKLNRSSKGQKKSKSKLVISRYSQKTNGRIRFVCRADYQSKQNKFGRMHLGRS